MECRFLPGTVLSVSYLVKTPTLGSEVQTQGMFGVQLRIAKGRCLYFNTYYCFVQIRTCNIVLFYSCLSTQE